MPTEMEEYWEEADERRGNGREKKKKLDSLSEMLPKKKAKVLAGGGGQSATYAVFRWSIDLWIINCTKFFLHCIAA